jgi:GH24 family phage-related lysozyme (muramidase)
MTLNIAEVQSAFDSNSWFDAPVPTPTKKKEEEAEKPAQPPPTPEKKVETTNDNGNGIQAEKKTLTLSENGLKYLKGKEELRLKEYGDLGTDKDGNPKGKLTIGYGHVILPGEDYSKGITETKANEIFKKDLAPFEKAVNQMLKEPQSQSQFDALVIFAFNAGSAGLQGSTLMKNINSKKDVTLGNFTAWNRGGDGKVMEGLTIRRTDEFNIYSKGKYPVP